MKKFGAISLDEEDQCLWRDGERILLPPKSFQVLAFLVSRAGRLVTKEELLDAVWPDTFVQEAVLKVCILEIRKAIGDTDKERRFIETAHRRGYRFVAPVTETAAAPLVGNGLPGRESELTALERFLDRVSKGQRHIVFLAGEAGLGKSTLVDHFLTSAAKRSVRTARGACIEHLGSREAYYPLFGALSSAVIEGSVPNLGQCLRTYAPTWLREMPALVDTGESENLRRETAGATRDRMLREICDALEALSAEQPLALALEDLHWADVSTLDFISMLASRGPHARLLLLLTYRPVDVTLHRHPIRQVMQNLIGRGSAVEIELTLLPPDGIGELIARRYPGGEPPHSFRTLIHQRSGGNPLFAVNLLEHASARGMLDPQQNRWELDPAVPDNLTQLIRAQVEQLEDEERSVLERASAVGLQFAVSLLMAEGETQAALEETFDSLAARGLFIESAGIPELERGNASSGAVYRFRHALYREVLYRGVAPARLRRLHRLIFARLQESLLAGKGGGGTIKAARDSAAALRLAGEPLGGSDPGAAASQLALHAEGCHEWNQAIRYLRLHAQRSVGRHALPEGLDTLGRARVIAGHLAEPDRTEVVLAVTEELAQVLRLMGRLADAEVEFRAMYALAGGISDAEACLRAQLHLATVNSWIDREQCLKAADEAVALCERMADRGMRDVALGQAAYWSLLFRGWDSADAVASERGLAGAHRLGDPVLCALHTIRHAFFQCLRGEYDEACATAAEGYRLATSIDGPVDYSLAHYFHAWALLHAGRREELRVLLRTALEMAQRNGHRLWEGLFILLEAFLLVEEGEFRPARDRAAPALQRARELNHSYSVQMGLVVAGLAYTGCGQQQEARKVFEEVRTWQQRQRLLMDWIWKMPLHYGLTLLCVQEGNVAGARREAALLTAAAGDTAEPTWRALAHAATAEVELKAANVAGARDALQRGLQTLRDRRAPIAERRLRTIEERLRSDVAYEVRA